MNVKVKPFMLPLPRRCLWVIVVTMAIAAKADMRAVITGTERCKAER
jgi:hypothetical protein